MRSARSSASASFQGASRPQPAKLTAVTRAAAAARIAQAFLLLRACLQTRSPSTTDEVMSAFAMTVTSANASKPITYANWGPGQFAHNHGYPRCHGKIFVKRMSQRQKLKA